MELAVFRLNVLDTEIVGAIFLERECTYNEAQGADLLAQSLLSVRAVYRVRAFHISTVAHHLVVFSTVVCCLVVADPANLRLLSRVIETHRYANDAAVYEELCYPSP